MQNIVIFYKHRRIILWEKTEELEIKVDKLEIEEPFLHKCTDRMNNILNVFFKNENMEEISFEHYDLNKLLNDFKTYFKYIEAAGGLVKNNRGELLVIHRLGVPDLPKGKIEKGETPIQAAIREVEEECGISNLIVLEKAQSSYHIYSHKGKWVLKKTFWFHMKYEGSEPLMPQTEEDITSVEWCNAANLSNFKLKTYDSLRPYFAS